MQVEETYAQIIVRVGEACNLMGDFDKSIPIMEKHIQNFLGLYPNNHFYLSWMYYVIGVCYAMKSEEVKALHSYEKHIEHYVNNNEKTYTLECYSFRPCNEHSLYDLCNNTITVSNPIKFNDPMDCLIYPWFEFNKDTRKCRGQELADNLLVEAYSHVKVRCFVKSSQTIEATMHSSNGEDEKYNQLMWAHYADGHRGFCVKYEFLGNKTCDDYLAEDLSTFHLSRFKDVIYEQMVNLSSELPISKAFFVKNKKWEYEHEVRLLHYDSTWKSDHKPIKIPRGCVKEVYFGLKCSEENKQAIREALAGQQVKFFQIETQPHDFYKLTSKPTLEPTRKRYHSRFLSLFKKFSLSFLKK